MKKKCHSIKYNSENKTWMVMSNLGTPQVVEVYLTKADAYNYVRKIQENKLDEDFSTSYLSRIKKNISNSLVSRYGRHVAN